MSEQIPIILASGSQSRASLLRGAGVEFEQITSKVDEDSVKMALRAEGASTQDQAIHLAELKALKVSRQKQGIVLGADQMLDLDGVAFDKPKDLAEARRNLIELRGRTHVLETAIVACQNGDAIWRAYTRPSLRMRDFSDAFLDDYLDRCGDAVLTSVGCYQLESLGSQLFSDISGDYFSILGLPLIQLLTWFRDRGVVLK